MLREYDVLFRSKIPQRIQSSLFSAYGATDRRVLAWEHGMQVHKKADRFQYHRRGRRAQRACIGDNVG